MEPIPTKLGAVKLIIEPTILVFWEVKPRFRAPAELYRVAVFKPAAPKVRLPAIEEVAVLETFTFPEETMSPPDIVRPRVEAMPAAVRGPAKDEVAAPFTSRRPPKLD